MALLITEKIQFENPSIGIVAFSQTQLNCIWNHLDNNTQNKLQDLIDLNLAFFKSLENVQGEECDFLFISLGYAKNETGDFHMRFGPINQKTGTKRLNVLLTRAKVSIDFVCSVQSTDFKLTTNESIRLLQLFLQQIENPKAQILNAFPHQLTPSINYTTKTSTFTSITNTLNNVNELVTLQRVLQNRGWNVKYN
ncbi:MAG: hypothetical protein HYR91_03710 [Flavobacteriia bacterium]|nr:hypothetical protein [Flavobacteriia bacterium]